LKANFTQPGSDPSPGEISDLLMTCPVCGKASPCVHTNRNAAALLDHETFTDEAELAVTANGTSSSEAAWRQEIASRLEQHRARRRQPADHRTMRLDFSTDTPHSFGALASDSALPPPPARFAEIVLETARAQEQIKPEPKIIRFPRTQATFIPTIEEVTLDELELAAPAPEIPRIMEVAEPDPEEEMLVEVAETEYVEPYPAVQVAALEGEQLNLLPSFADIRLEPESSIDDDLEVIPRPAPLQQRFISGLIDVAIVGIATGAFVLTFAELAEEMPRMTWIFMPAAGGIFWAIFQYIFLTFRRATPGMCMAQLELCTFAGTETTAHARQSRALASALSGFSMGLGYAWALMDEDRMGWHDRISHTQVRAIYSSFVLPSFLKFQSLAAEPRDPYEFDDLKD